MRLKANQAHQVGVDVARDRHVELGQRRLVRPNQLVTVPSLAKLGVHVPVELLRRGADARVDTAHSAKQAERSGPLLAP